jgi:prophage maintenance system killer protein
MDDFDPDSISPQDLDRYRQAAEQAWGDDTRHPNYVGHPLPSAGQCYITSAWMQSLLGGHVGSRQGHYFWVAPDRSHVIDLTGDQFQYVPKDEEPNRLAAGPVAFKRADHPDYKGFRLADRDLTKNPRVRIFSQRANAALNNQKTADLMGADPYPGETPEKVDQWNQPAFHDEPGYEPEEGPHQFQFVFANGQLQVSPAHSHEELLGHAGSSPDHTGPLAVGYADVQNGHVTWRVESNVGLQGLRDALAHYSHQVGWKFDGLVGTDGQPMGLNLGPIMSFWYRMQGDTVQIAKTPMRQGHRIHVTGSTAYVDKLHPGLVDWAGDLGLALREVSRYNQRDEYAQEGSAKGIQDVSGSLRSYESQKVAQGDEEAQVEPEFPDSGDAQAIHDQSMADYGQGHVPLLRPEILESGMGRAANYWHYGQGPSGERIADAAGALAHGIGMSQAFEDGNKRTAYHTTRYFLHNNGYGNLSPVDQDDEELADHLIGHGEGTHTLEDTQQMFRSRLPTYDPSPPTTQIGRRQNVGRTAEYPGGGNMLDHMKNREWLDTFNNGDPDWQPERQNLDKDPGGPFVCPQCGAKPQTFGEYKLHMDDHETKDELPIEDGHFPQLQDFDEPLGFGSQPLPNGGNTIAMVLPTQHEAKRIPEFALYRDLFGFDDNCRYYGAYRNGECLGYGVVKVSKNSEIWKLWEPGVVRSSIPAGGADNHDGNTPEILMIQSAVHGQGVGTAILEKIKLHYSHFYSHADTDAGAALMRSCGMVNVSGHRWVYSAGNEPKDMIEQDVPFVYDIPTDKLYIGYAGSSSHDVPGRFSPGGIVEGYYQPGGKVLIQTASSWPYSVRHLLELWYHTAPQMEVTSIEHVEKDGSSTKLARSS